MLYSILKNKKRKNMLNQKTPQSLRSASFQGRGDIVVPQRAARLNQIKQSAKVSAPDQHLDAIGFVRPISDITPKTPVVHDVTPKVCTPSVMDIAPQYKKTASTATGSPQYTRPVVQYSRPHVVRSGRVISDIGSIKQPSTISQSNATASVAVQQFAKDKSVASNFDTSSHIKPVYEPTAQKVQRLSFFRMLRYIVPVAVMLVGGFLTYDTWVTNRAVEVRASAFPSVKAEPQESTEATSSDAKIPPSLRLHHFITPISSSVKSRTTNPAASSASGSYSTLSGFCVWRS